jgi:hypothetical protein
MHLQVVTPCCLGLLFDMHLRMQHAARRAHAAADYLLLINVMSLK